MTDGGKDKDIEDGAKYAGFVAGASGRETDEMKKLLQDPKTPQRIKDAYIDGVINAGQANTDPTPEDNK